MDEIPRNSDQVAEYEKEIQELRWQIQKLQEAGNLKDYTGKNHYILLQSINLNPYFYSMSHYLVGKGFCDSGGIWIN